MKDVLIIVSILVLFLLVYHLIQVQKAANKAKASVTQAIQGPDLTLEGTFCYMANGVTGGLIRNGVCSTEGMQCTMPDGKNFGRTVSGICTLIESTACTMTDGTKGLVKSGNCTAPINNVEL